MAVSGGGLLPYYCWEHKEFEFTTTAWGKKDWSSGAKC